MQIYLHTLIIVFSMLLWLFKLSKCQMCFWNHGSRKTAVLLYLCAHLHPLQEFLTENIPAHSSHREPQGWRRALISWIWAYVYVHTNIDLQGEIKWLLTGIAVCSANSKARCITFKTEGEVYPLLKWNLAQDKSLYTTELLSFKTCNTTARVMHSV